MTTFPSLILEINHSSRSPSGPALLGWTRGWWGSYSVVLVLCVVFQAAFSLIVVLRGER